MPTYEYQCRTCGYQFEQMQRFSDPPLTECPKCGGEVRRVLFPAGVIFKGSGWYITDSRKSGSESNGAKAAPAGEPTGEKATEKTPASTTD